MSMSAVSPITGLTIGAAARRSGVNAKAIRYYESIGLLSAADRTEGGFRTFDQNDVLRLRLIGRARRLGFSLDEIRRIVELYALADASKREIRDTIVEQVADIDQRMADLRAIRATLLDLIEPDVPWQRDVDEECERRAAS